MLFNDIFSSGTWFLHAYVFMMCFTPIVNKLLDQGSKDPDFSCTIPFLVAVFGVGWVINMPVVSKFMPQTSGLAAFSGITLLGVYIIGRLLRCKDVLNRVSVKLSILALSVAAFMSCIGVKTGNGNYVSGFLGQYNSPVALIAAIGAFKLFLSLPKISPDSYVGKAILFLAPSMFSIYIIHVNPQWFSLIKAKGGNQLVLTVCVFLGALSIDLFRRLIVGFFSKLNCFRKSGNTSRMPAEIAAAENQCASCGRGE